MDKAAYSEKIIRLIERADAHFSLGERSEAVRDRYCELLVGTVLAETEVGDVSFGCDVSPASACFFIDDLSRAIISRPELANLRFMTLAAEWWRYARSYAELVERSPLMELGNYLSLLSESHVQASWSDDVELLVQWLDGGAHGTPPINDDHRVLTKRMVNRLLAIRAATGGWLYNNTWGFHFLNDDQFKLIETAEDPKSFLEAVRRTRPSFEGC